MLLEGRPVRLDSVDGVLELSHLVLKALEGLLDHGGDLCELSNIEGNGREGLHLLECAKCLKLRSAGVLGIFSLRR